MTDESGASAVVQLIMVGLASAIIGLGFALSNPKVPSGQRRKKTGQVWHYSPEGQLELNGEGVWRPACGFWVGTGLVCVAPPGHPDGKGDMRGDVPFPPAPTELTAPT